MSYSEIKAIQTRYAGHFFRSRLEARWAVFFSHLQIKWQYEIEGFPLPSGPYLPDFYLPAFSCFFEVKPFTTLTFEEKKKTREYKLGYELVEATTSENFLLIYGTPLECLPSEWVFNNNPTKFQLYHGVSIIRTSKKIKFFTNDYTYDEIKNAAVAASEARFEHGEKP